MSLTSLWLTSPDQLHGKLVHQVISFAGDGKLRDGGTGSAEFREFLAHVPSATLEQYAKECLGDEKFADGGCALQDVVNEVGRRIGFRVDSGLYRGKSNEIGFDGVWCADDGFAVVVEVKTTDAYNISLETLAAYRKRLIAAGRLEEDKSSLLIVVGRDDTGSLEAQVRGSQHAWDIRLISVDALLSLMKVKEQLDNPQTIRKIRAVLTPREFTKVDGIIDLVFTTAAEVKSEEEELPIEDDEERGDKKPKFRPVNFREACAEKIQRFLGKPLIKRSFAFFSSADEQTGVCCLISREYGGPDRLNFWFAFHPHQKEELEKHENAFVAFGCGSQALAFVIPFKEFAPWLDKMNVTNDESRGVYWHVKIRREKGRFFLKPKMGGTRSRSPITCSIGRNPAGDAVAVCDFSLGLCVCLRTTRRV